jgi:hypothetical protein
VKARKDSAEKDHPGRKITEILKNNMEKVG